LPEAQRASGKEANEKRLDGGIRNFGDGPTTSAEEIEKKKEKRK
jgi:hypothetical protein